MTEFLETSDGHLSERKMHDLAAWFHSQAPETSALDFEAQLELVRAHQSVTIPQDRAGRKRFNNARFNLLRLLYQTPRHRLLMTEIAQGLGINITNVTGLVNDLVKEGVVRRAEHAQDKRKKWAELTPKGERAFEQDLPTVSAVVRKLWSVLSEEEKRQLITILSKLRLGLLRTNIADQAAEIRTLNVDSLERS